MVQGVILDVDGTLVLSNDAQAQAWVDAFAAYGYIVAFEQVRPFIGMGGDQLMPKVMPVMSNDEGDRQAVLERRKQLMINRYGAKLSPTNGARQLVQHMRSQGLKLIIASSATSEELAVLLKSAGVDDLIIEKTTWDDAQAVLPAPDIIEVALNKLQMEPEQVVMLGDTPYDVRSASAAKVGVISLRCGGFEDRALAGSLAIYDDPADLLANYASSPLSAT